MSELGEDLLGKVDTKGMWGTYEGGLKFVEEGGLQYPSVVDSMPFVTAGFSAFDRAMIDSSPTSSLSTGSDLMDSDISPSTTPDRSRPPLHIFFLGSTLGNFSRKESVDFLRALPLSPGAGDTLLLGLDHNNDKDLIEEAYNDRRGYTRKFIMNGLRAAGRVLGDENIFEEDKWEYVGTYNTKERMSSRLFTTRLFIHASHSQGCHEGYFRSNGPQTLQVPSSTQGISFLADELIQIEVSHKVGETHFLTFTKTLHLYSSQTWMLSRSLPKVT